jgi:hypothetical protein
MGRTDATFVVRDVTEPSPGVFLADGWYAPREPFGPRLRVASLGEVVRREVDRVFDERGPRLLSDLAEGRL